MARTGGVRLGAFQLIEPLGSGGIAVAWRGVHDRGVPVALKVLHARFADQELLERSFAQEVRALARLDHPAIAAVLDFGKVDPETARASGGDLAAGVPWLALELGSSGSLAERRNRPTSEQGLTELVATLLSALAHAHARGVLHRDLKPQNVVLRGPGDHRAGPMLVDFGLASFLGGPPEAGTEAGGTPRYASPEQLDGDWRAFGPWTDLYGLGVLIRSLAGGEPWLRDWIRTATALDPAERFDCAASALAALPRAARTVRWPRVPPILSTIGLPLLELRRPRLVGRTREQRTLLAAQRRVARTGRPEHLALRGPPGVGRSALLQWLAERSHERAEATVVAVEVDAEGQVAIPTLRRWLVREPPPDESQALVELVSRLATARRPVLLTADPADEVGPLVRAVLRLEAPVLVVTVGAPPGASSGAVLDVEPLSTGTLARVLDELLPLERSTVLRLAAEADGRVAHARRLLAHYVRSGAMVERDQRWALDGAEPPRFEDRWLGPLVGAGSPVTLGLAAALGPRVSLAQWAEACARPPAVDDRARILAALLAAGLVEETADGFEHLQPAFRSAVLTWIERQGLAADVHGRCADTLPADTPRRQQAVGTHLRAAGRIAEAVDALRAAVVGLDRELRYDQVLVALAELEACGPAVPAEDRTWARRQRLYALLHVGSHQLAETEAEAVLADPTIDRALAADATRITAVARIRSGRRAEGEEAARRAVALGRGTATEFSALLVLVDCLVPTRLDEAWTVAERMAALLPGSASAMERLGRIAQLRGDRATASALLEAVVASGTSDRLAVRSAHVVLGEIRREDGDLAQAERHYLAAIEGLSPFVEGGEVFAVGWLNLAVVALERGDPEAARRRLDRLAEACGPLTRSLVPLVDLVTAGCAAAVGDLGEVEARIARVAAAVDDPSLWQRDSVVWLGRCAVAARAGGRDALAERAEAAAAAIGARLGG